MQKFLTSITSAQESFLRKEKERTGLAMAEIVRRSLDMYRAAPRAGGSDAGKVVIEAPASEPQGDGSRSSHTPF